MPKRRTTEAAAADGGPSPKGGQTELRPSSHCCSKLRKPLQSHRTENEDEQDTGNIDFSNHGFDYKVRFGWAPEVRRRPIHDDSDPSDDTSSVTSWDEFNENADSFKWLESIEARAYERTSTGRENIATCEANFIPRDKIRIRFQETMDELQNPAEFASDLFDRHGRLKKEYVQHEIRKGSGIWGHELDKGNLVLFDSIKIDEAFRCKKIASDLVEKIWTQFKKMWRQAESPELKYIPSRAQRTYQTRRNIVHQGWGLFPRPT